jgi:hypothetical protein
VTAINKPDRQKPPRRPSLPRILAMGKRENIELVVTVD